MASSNKEDSPITNTNIKSSSNIIKEDSQQHHTENDSTQKYEAPLNEESNSRLSNVGEKVVETVKHGVNTILGTTNKSSQEQQIQHPSTVIRSASPSSKIAQKQISEIEEEYLFVVSRTEY
ncbi:hypothetical protein RclHR1_02210008 [Rhizophagus clarus]|uniref:Uncharacterized protein n=1 Tax=Rhizophagus clarus TaxID=94130 RepID=A0A2Z6QTG4_9GLOM|nr:hypothetical protein RclHR1_02210008 [Rhizophagus clarus]GET00186.1 hypothetical protein RCL_jg3115.t1 [Rhizophagus clarus]